MNRSGGRELRKGENERRREEVPGGVKPSSCPSVTGIYSTDLVTLSIVNYMVYGSNDRKIRTRRAGLRVGKVKTRRPEADVNAAHP